MKEIKSIIEMLKLLVSPYRISFVRGHPYLTDGQVLRVKQVLKTNNNQETVKQYEQKMTSLTGNGYGISFAAGRMAFYTIMKALGIGKGDEVILPGFTCSVMPNAVWRTGAKPVFSDIDIETLGSSAQEIQKKITPKTKMIVSQHSFGIPCNMPSIVEIGKKHNIFVMEDSAIALESSIDGVKVGNWGDAAIFSTDHSKPINTLIGGFLYTKNRSFYEKVKEISSSMPQLEKVHQERLYNQFLYERKSYTPRQDPRSSFINFVKSAIKNNTSKSRPLIFLEGDYKKPDQMSLGYPYPAKMPPFLAQVGLFELKRWDGERRRRKKLLNEYLGITQEMEFLGYIPKAYFKKNLDIVPLRFAHLYPNSKNLMKKMAKFIDINWIWYRTPIVCAPDGPESLGYQPESCKISEKTCNEIINWPCILPDGWDNKMLEIFKKVIKDTQLK